MRSPHPESRAPEAPGGRKRFGDWLLATGHLTPRQLDLAIQERQRRPSTPLGQICVELGFLDPRRLDGLLARFRKCLPIGELLVRQGLLTREQLAQAVQAQRQSGHRLGEVLVGLRLVDEEQLCEALARQYDLPFLHLKQVVPERELRTILNPLYAAQNRAVPVTLIGRRLTVGVADPTRRGWMEELHRATGFEIVPVLTPPSELAEFYQALYGRPLHRAISDRRSAKGGGADSEESAATEAPLLPSAPNEISLHGSGPAGRDPLDLDLEVSEEDAGLRASKYAVLSEDSPVVQTLVQRIIARALSLRASDIHLELDVDGPRLRLRVDGMLGEVSLGQELDRQYRVFYRSVISRLKILCQMDITERRRPQDGSFRIFARRGGRLAAVDFRLSTLPGRFGEGMAIRVLDEVQAPRTLESLGLSPEAREQFRQLIARPQGILLITGPTGSGKSSTLYAALRTIYRPELKILTAEDPIEFTHPGIVQAEVNPAIENTFARFLRAFLRQDPDVIMVGEIRDAETAEMAQRAAMTGHLLLSTLHTTSATAAVARLLDLGVDPNSLANTLIGAMAQRLVRRICPACSEPAPPSPEVLREWFESPPAGIVWRRGRGCRECQNSGFLGRMAAAEIWVPSPHEAMLVRKRTSADELRDEALQRMPCLGEDALRKAMRGWTTLEEATRVVPYEDIRFVRTHGPDRVLRLLAGAEEEPEVGEDRPRKSA